MSNNQHPTANFQVTFCLGAHYLEIGSWSSAFAKAMADRLDIQLYLIY